MHQVIGSIVVTNLTLARLQVCFQVSPTRAGDRFLCGTASGHHKSDTSPLSVWNDELCKLKKKANKNVPS